MSGRSWLITAVCLLILSACVYTLVTYESAFRDRCVGKGAHVEQEGDVLLCVTDSGRVVDVQ